ncbi:MAG: hypothetical protein K2O91_14920, partial [Lachnospiraceae bacterium]|nr:hypothetical protein [Lachnospiraceae bacterium]
KKEWMGLWRFMDVVGIGGFCVVGGRIGTGEGSVWRQGCGCFLFNGSRGVDRFYLTAAGLR